MNKEKQNSSRHISRGVICMITAFLFVAVCSALVKGVSDTRLPTPVIVFFESLIPLTAIVIWHLRKGVGKFSLATKHPGWQVTHGIVGLSPLPGRPKHTDRQWCSSQYLGAALHPDCLLLLV